jgi:putative ABC transport system ATP-binding protein
MDLLVGAAREQGTTVVLVTHEPRVAAYADREVIVRDGQVRGLDAESGAAAQAEAGAAGLAGAGPVSA